MRKDSYLAILVNWLESIRGEESGRDLKANANMALILSVNEGDSPNTFRVSVQWQGNHSIADFVLEQFGKVLSIRDEAENKGWAH